MNCRRGTYRCALDGSEDDGEREEELVALAWPDVALHCLRNANLTQMLDCYSYVVTLVIAVVVA